jgi:hypothetical protein
MKKKNRHIMKVARTGEIHEMEYMAYGTPGLVMKEDIPDDEFRRELDKRCQLNLDRTGHPFRHMAADGTVVTPDPAVSYLLSRIPMDDQEYITEMWQQYIKPDAMPAIPVDENWYTKHPIPERTWKVPLVDLSSPARHDWRLVRLAATDS